VEQVRSCCGDYRLANRVKSDTLLLTFHRSHSPREKTVPRSVVGLDIGGANLKAAHASGPAISQPFALWKNPAGLADALRLLLRGLPAFDALAVTMTGELCDCFETKRQGVRTILDAVGSVAGPTPVKVWQTDGRLVDLATAREQPLLAAAGNWLALATYAGRFASTGPALMVDIGSTTTDIIPLRDGQPVPVGRNDTTRLRHHELIYTGVRRTPVCALLGSEGAAEWFATTQDVYLVLHKTPENAADCDTADGRPATRAFAHARLARMICADVESCTEEDRRGLALRICNRQTMLIRQAMESMARAMAGPLSAVILAGSGEFLARAALELRWEQASHLPPAERVISLTERLGKDISDAACAHALAVLASEADDGK
jgi:(4-(4-[2-(gamma-L-glutamylamino)ethyl]phenoxymethyl)furan-2-yl)methanamine synthase